MAGRLVGSSVFGMKQIHKWARRLYGSLVRLVSLSNLKRLGARDNTEVASLLSLLIDNIYLN